MAVPNGYQGLDVVQFFAENSPYATLQQQWNERRFLWMHRGASNVVFNGFSAPAEIHFDPRYLRA